MAGDTGEEEKKGWFAKIKDKLGGWKGIAAVVGCGIVGNLIFPGAGFLVGALVGAGGAYVVQKRAEKRKRIKEMAKEARAERIGWEQEREPGRGRGRKREVEGRSGYVGGQHFGSDSYGREEDIRRKEYSRSGHRSHRGRSGDRSRGSRGETRGSSVEYWQQLRATQERGVSSPGKTPSGRRGGKRRSSKRSTGRGSSRF